MTYKDLLKGKKKLAFIPALVVLATYFWPFLLGGILSFFAYKRIPSTVVKFALIALITLFSIPAGSGWLAGMASLGATVDQKEKSKVETVKTEEKTIIQAITVTPSPTQQPTPSTIPTVTIKPKATPTPTKKLVPTPTKNPVIVYPTATKIPVQRVQTQVQPIAQPVQQTGGGSGCNCSLTCTQMTSCSEAQYQLNTCGCSARDGDDDGIACDGAPLHCQN